MKTIGVLRHYQLTTIAWRCGADTIAWRCGADCHFYTQTYAVKLHYTNATLSLSPISVVMTGSYNNFFRMFDRGQRRDLTLEASRENNKPMQVLKPRKVSAGGKRKKDEISVDSLDFNKKILHTTWHPQDNIIAVATTNNLYIFQDKVN